MITLKVRRSLYRNSLAVFCSRNNGTAEEFRQFVPFTPRRVRKIYRKNADDLQGPFEMSRDEENSSH